MHGRALPLLALHGSQYTAISTFMDFNYESCYGGYQYDYEYHYSEVGCVISGEPHYTQDCYHYQGDQSEVKSDDSEERVTATLQSLLDFSERLEAKQSKESEERSSKEELVGIQNMEAHEGCMEQSGVSITSETTSYEEPDCKTNNQEEILQEDTNKEMTMVAPLP
ncbi:hypothetical protein L1987_46202 [Smallanthus sonchifolius]|uniref:Uncharacterized protein n=1 Tax=Smallanthus sonchifolius TaxID=185202 RepID=A0ACB9G039_9ASTR|nr:hypothetical protein L1987_46202 [Smallanthus sonchifolius]